MFYDYGKKEIKQKESLVGLIEESKWPKVAKDTSSLLKTLIATSESPFKDNRRKSIVISKEDGLAAAKASTTSVEGGNLTSLDKEAKICPW